VEGNELAALCMGFFLVHHNSSNSSSSWGMPTFMRQLPRPLQHTSRPIASC
jgi:hypothetical protein